LIKITEKAKDGTDQSSLTQKIQVTLENKEEKTFESYPIAIKSKDIKHLIYEIQKSTSIKNNTTHTGGFMDKVKEKAKEVKDAVVGSTKGAAGKAKDTGSPSSSSPQSSESPQSSDSIMDKVKEKAKDAKDAVVDTTKGAAGKAKDTGSGSDAATSDTGSGSETVVTETTTTETKVEPS
jgi:hypothetical protein